MRCAATPAFVLARVSMLTAPGRLRLSDTGSESAVGAVAALLLAGFGRLASTWRIELRRGVLAVALRASRALRVRLKHGGKARGEVKAGPLAAVTHMELRSA
jgi:hypothetical protein